MSLKQPVQYPVKYYSYTDTDAPQLADADGVIKTILKACLVTGYGDGADAKEGAGWTALFEDDYRLVLRRPLGTGSPPDIKIENGVINGAPRHRIVSQDDPTGLDDAVELAAVNLLARDSQHGNEWHLIVSDFGFILCYQMGRQFSGDRNYLMYVGSMQEGSTSMGGFYATTNAEIGRNGVVGSNQEEFFGSKNKIVDMRNGVNRALSQSSFITVTMSEKQLVNDYSAQKAITPFLSQTPFYIAITESYDDKITKTVNIDGRQFLRYVNVDRFSVAPRAFYIPLDYWEL